MADAMFGAGADELGLCTDLYELTMAQAYWWRGMDEPATFSLFFRTLPRNRNFMLACGQVHAARVAPELRFPRDQLHALADTGLFREAFLRTIEAFRFSGSIRAMPEGTPVFPQEPVLEVDAPILEAQVLESLMMNLVHLETLLASKAVRFVLAAGDRPVLDFGMRRMHGVDAAVRGVRAYHAAGLAGTSNVLGATRHGLPARGTMAHSFVQASADELEAFRTYARLYPGTVLLVDTYDTLTAVDRVIGLVRDEGLQVGAIRIDSGELCELARACRSRLDAAGLHAVQIVVSGGLDEWAVRDLLAAGAPVDGFGVGTEMGASSDAPTIDFAYKLTEYAGTPRFKHAPGKAIVPGPKQVWRHADSLGMYQRDSIALRHEADEGGTPLLEPVVTAGACEGPPPEPDAARERARQGIARLPAPLRVIDPARQPYPVDFTPAAEALQRQTLGTT